MLTIFIESSIIYGCLNQTNMNTRVFKIMHNRMNYFFKNFNNIYSILVYFLLLDQSVYDLLGLGYIFLWKTYFYPKFLVRLQVGCQEFFVGCLSILIIRRLVKSYRLYKNIYRLTLYYKILIFTKFIFFTIEGIYDNTRE